MLRTNLYRPDTVENDRDWEIFVKYVERFVGGTTIANEYELSRSRTHGIYKEVREQYEASGQEVPEYGIEMPTWRADTDTQEKVQYLEKLFPGLYDQMLRKAVDDLYRHIRQADVMHTVLAERERMKLEVSDA